MIDLDFLEGSKGSDGRGWGTTLTLGRMPDKAALGGQSPGPAGYRSPRERRESERQAGRLNGYVGVMDAVAAYRVWLAKLKTEGLQGYNDGTPLGVCRKGIL